MKKHLSLLFASVLLFSLLFTSTFTVSAGFENKVFEEYVYVVIDGMVTIINVDTDISGEVVIPSFIEGYPVTGIDDRSFDNCDQIVTLKIPASVTYIGEAAFEECTSLTEFIVSFGNKTFCAYDGVLYTKDTTKLICYPPGKKNTEFAIPDGVKKVDTAAFAHASHLKRITVADGVESLGTQAFYGCTRLKQITFGLGLTEIGEEAFAHCSALASITIPNSVKSVGVSAFQECSKLSDVTIGRGLTRLSGTLFLNCTALKTVELPDNVTAVSASAFSKCRSLKSITISKSLTSIGSYAFFGCDNLKTILYSGSEADRSAIVVGAKNEVLNTAKWQYSAPSVAQPPDDTSVGPQPIGEQGSNVTRSWAMIGGAAAVLAAAIIVLIVVLVKGIKARA